MTTPNAGTTGTTGCTVVTPLLPDPAAIYQLLADIDPELRLYVNEEDLCVEVLHPERDVVLVVIEEPQYVQVLDEAHRLLGSRLGFPQAVLDRAEGLYWLDVHMVEQSDEALELLVLFSLNMAERGHGAYSEHNPGQLAFPASTIELGTADTPEEMLEPMSDPRGTAADRLARHRPPDRRFDDEEQIRGNRWN